jgi:deoxyribodipyrimidine photolyase-related protein
MKNLRVILGDQLSYSVSSLDDCDKANDVILMCEVWAEATYVKHHKKKIAFLFSAMRHFAQELRQQGYNVRYTKFDDPDNARSFKGEVMRAVEHYGCDQVILTHPSEYRVLADVQTWQQQLGVVVSILPDNRFLCDLDAFNAWAGKSKQLRMEYFYREMRKQYSILMVGDQPVGAKWNYDSENRNPAKAGLTIPKPYLNPVDDITAEVIQLVSRYFPDHFGDVEPFYFAVNREQALQCLELFIAQRLVNFGDYQDAMLEGEPWLYHSHISFYLNCGLLLPLECVRRVEEAYNQGAIPLNSAEGFIRQIIGWREYVRGIYWLKMPDYAKANFLEAKRDLPSFYWHAKTKMNCIKQCIIETKQNAYAHHIQRLMVLGNFTLLAGIDPEQVNQWFLTVYADAYEWVELPNVSGMVLFADGGYLATKPYAAGGSYINKMSDYCKNCDYKVSKKSGDDACPFNYLYWYFLVRNRSKLQHNYRISMMYKTYDKMSTDKKQAILEDGDKFFEAIARGITV